MAKGFTRRLEWGAKGKYQQEEKIVQEMCQSEGHERLSFF